MKTGLLLPAWSHAVAGATLNSRELLDFAAQAVSAGFESLWVSDHFLNEPYVDYAAVDIQFPEEYRGIKSGQWECWSLMAALAARIPAVTLGTLVSNTAFRNPALLARIIDTVDDLSGGRVVAGLGAGDFASEHRAFGYDFARPIARFEEALAIIRPLLRGETLSHAGEFYRTEGATLLPKSLRSAGPPLMIGLLRGGPRMLRLVAEYADQWNCMLPFADSRVTSFIAAWERVRVACEKHGRDPATLARNVTVGVCLGDNYPLPGAQPLRGSRQQLIDACAAYREQGVETLSMVIEPYTPASLETLAPVLAAL
jgi:alkanesulfonate monooxygenase SsuD/methylene tetrahydromethanopterin reductase-like flavin-dependent oxidoreductase (luciferase family)